MHALMLRLVNACYRFLVLSRLWLRGHEYWIDEQ